jgi:hypothetical protein
VYCHKCHFTGDALALWAWARCMTLRDAAYDLCDTFGIDYPYLVR